MTGTFQVDSSRPMKHVSRKDLYTSLETRIAYLHDFLDFNSSDVEALSSGAKYIKTLIPAIVNIVYKKLLETDITARAFHTRTTADETPIEEFIGENSPQILHRKMFLRMYLLKLCSDPTQMEFWRYLDKVGMMHCGAGRKDPLVIEYSHIGVCLGFIQDIFTEALLSHPRLPLPRKIALVRAIGKVIWIQNDLFAKWYVRDGEEFADVMSSAYSDEEGYVDGKKVLVEDVPQNGVSPPTARPPSSGCPFSIIGDNPSAAPPSGSIGETNSDANGSQS